MKRKHHMPFGAECCENGSVRFRLWAPEAQRVDLVLHDTNSRALSLVKNDEGWFELTTDEAGVGSRYNFQIDGRLNVPDPASRFQPLDVNGPSEVVNPIAFEWQDGEWHGSPWEETVIYELHVGTFTPAGTFRALEERLDYLVELGITALELMPVSDFSGRRNWGYDGVLPYAPDNCYGTPDDLKKLIQSAHRKGLMVFLDVVYNHFGPEGNYLREYSQEFFTERHQTPWGDAINFDGRGSRVVRDFFIHNALYWLEEYRFDGLRLDAVHEIVDDSVPHILTELADHVRKNFEGKRHVHLILENYRNIAHYLVCDEQNQARWYDAQWNDDIHHTLHVLTTKEKDGYYSDYSHRPIELLGRCLTEGFAYQGERSQYHKEPRGEVSRHLPPTAFVSFLQNHDQIGNRAFGERITALADEQAVKAAMAILLLAPSPPLLFMGEEFAAQTPFLFFCDFHGKLAADVTQGRRAEFAGFSHFRSQDVRDRIPDPHDEQTFLQSKIDWESLKGEASQKRLRFYRELLALRKKEIVPLLHSAGAKAHANFCIYGQSGIAVKWHFGAAVLSLTGNLGSSEAVEIPRPCGRTLYTSLPRSVDRGPAQAQVEMRVWSVAWFLCP
jgi:maltooligosyltrehalose trehalohydrolase